MVPLVAGRAVLQQLACSQSVQRLQNGFRASAQLPIVNVTDLRVLDCLQL